MRAFRTDSVPPPMPGVRAVTVHAKEMEKAVQRLSEAWNMAQCEDSVASIRFWLQKVEESLESCSSNK